MSDIIKFLAMADVPKAVMDHKQTYMIIEINEFTTLGELADADGFMTVEKKEDQKPKPKPDPVPDPEEDDLDEEDDFEEEPEPAKTKGSRVDHGKLMALHKAKWTPKQIADELGCSVQTVLNHINKA